MKSPLAVIGVKQLKAAPKRLGTVRQTFDKKLLNKRFGPLVNLYF